MTVSIATTRDGVLIHHATTILADNIAANIMANDGINTPGNQYVRPMFHFVREAIKDGLVRVHYVKSEGNVADLMTKAVSKECIERLLPMLLGHCSLDFNEEALDRELKNAEAPAKDESENECDGYQPQ